ncbi:MAG: Flp pilus assembly complex ATPase component TadA [Elusimicrobia bacterium]|nr:Flp pilus assembly complex ATPase component TadA [Elusimicrobiota bacterium]
MEKLTAGRDEWFLRLAESRGLVAPEVLERLRGAPDPVAEAFSAGTLSHQAFGEALWDQYRLRLAEPQAGGPNALVRGLLPESVCRRRGLAPLGMEDGRIVVAMSNPLDVEALAEVAAVSGREAVARYALSRQVRDLIDGLYSADAVVYDLLRSLPESEAVECLAAEEGEGENALKDAVSTPIIRLANHLLSEAVRLGASDIHVEHGEAKSAVRYRIDGVLRTMMVLPRHVAAGALVSRIKIMARLDIADHRRPQDGRAKLRVGERELGLRVSTVPTSFGEKVVLRILDSRQAEVPLASLGFRPDLMKSLERLSVLPQGLLLVTGPTGSGKTTTLYSLLARLRGDGVNITTVEDPVEYRIAGINQIQVSDKTGLGFAAVLRAVLRQDPDIILVGEIRDRETADVAFQAAMTGHLVLSTLHTNDAAATIDRLLDMGVERFRIASGLMGVVSQRLVRRRCAACGGSGCQSCSGAGLAGRLAIAEVLDLSEPAVRRRLSAEPDTASFAEMARRAGWLRTLEEDVKYHLLRGETTAAEVASCLGVTLVDASPARPGRGGPVAGEAPGPGGTGPKVLIVDDQPDNRALMKMSLAGDGYVLCEACSGEEALSAAWAATPDLVLLDLMMPGVDGFAVLRRLRAVPATATVPVIVVTAVGEAEAQVLALQCGADDYLAKPFDPRVLRARAAALFRRKQAA